MNWDAGEAYCVPSPLEDVAKYLCIARQLFMDEIAAPQDCMTSDPQVFAPDASTPPAAPKRRPLGGEWSPCYGMETRIP